MNIINSIKHKILKITWFLTSFLHIQLFITLASLPILIAWGLPFSVMSPVGNLIFTPFLTLFLLLSSLIFFCELLFIPHSLIIYLLEQISSFWIYITEWGNRSWLMALTYPSIFCLCSITLVAFVILHFKQANMLYKNLTLFYALIITICLLNYPQNSNWNNKKIPCFLSSLELLSSRQTHILIDRGTLGSRISAPTYVTFQLIPELIRNGIEKIDYLICTKPSLMTFRAIALLCDKINIKKIYLPAWTGNLSNTEWRAWEELIAVCKKYNTVLVFMNKQTYILEFSNGLKIVLANVKLVKKNKFEFHEIKIDTQIDNANNAY